MECEENMLEQVIVLVWFCYLSCSVDNTRIYVNDYIVCQMSVLRRQVRLLQTLFPTKRNIRPICEDVFIHVHILVHMSSHLQVIDAPKKTARKRTHQFVI